MLIKLAVHEIPPASLSATRLIIGGLILFAVVLFTGERARYGGKSLGLIVLAGFIGNAVPFVLISWGEKTVDAGLASILMGYHADRNTGAGTFLYRQRTDDLAQDVGRGNRVLPGW